MKQKLKTKLAELVLMTSPCGGSYFILFTLVPLSLVFPHLDWAPLWFLWDSLSPSWDWLSGIAEWDLGSSTASHSGPRCIFFLEPNSPDQVLSSFDSFILNMPTSVICIFQLRACCITGMNKCCIKWLNTYVQFENFIYRNLRSKKGLVTRELI